MYCFHSPSFSSGFLIERTGFWSCEGFTARSSSESESGRSPFMGTPNKMRVQLKILNILFCIMSSFRRKKKKACVNEFTHAYDFLISNNIKHFLDWVPCQCGKSRIHRDFMFLVSQRHIERLKCILFHESAHCVTTCGDELFVRNRPLHGMNIAHFCRDDDCLVGDSFCVVHHSLR